MYLNRNMGERDRTLIINSGLQTCKESKWVFPSKHPITVWMKIIRCSQKKKVRSVVEQKSALYTEIGKKWFYRCYYGYWLTLIVILFVKKRCNGEYASCGKGKEGVKKIKFLGVFIGNHLSWSHHISKLIESIHPIAGQFF